MGSYAGLAVVFDLYGTLVVPPGGQTAHRRLAALVRQRGGEPDAVRGCMTEPSGMADFCKRAFGPMISDDEVSELEETATGEAAAAIPYGDAAGALARISGEGALWGVCSNLSRPFETALSRLPAEPDFKALSFEEGFLKPSPWIMGRALRSGLLEGRTLVVCGDSEASDGGLARALGCVFSRVDRRSGVDFSSPGGLFSILDALAGGRHGDVH